MDLADRAFVTVVMSVVGDAADGRGGFDNVDRLADQALRPFQDSEGCQNLILQRSTGKQGMQRLGGQGTGGGRRGFRGAPAEVVHASHQCDHRQKSSADHAREGKPAENEDGSTRGGRRVVDDDGCLRGGRETERVREPDFQRHRVRAHGGDLREIDLKLRLCAWRREAAS
jgi:hypothetical protein